MDIGVIGVPKIPKSQFIKVYSVANLSTLLDLEAYLYIHLDFSLISVVLVERRTKKIGTNS